MDEFCGEFILMCSEAERQITVYVINKFRNRLIKYRIVRVSKAVTYSIGARFDSSDTLLTIYRTTRRHMQELTSAGTSKFTT
jgi:hypothetical protein